MKKNILHVVNVYFVLPYFIGDQFLYFKSKNYDLNVVCSPSEYLEDYAKKMGFNYKEVKIVREINPLKDLIAMIAICKYIKNNKIDIVVGHTPKGALLAMLAAWIMRVPRRIYFRHGLVYETMTGFKRKFMIYMDRLCSVCSTKVVNVSHFVQAQSLRDGLNSDSKQIVLGDGTCGGIDAVNKFNPSKINEKKINELRLSLGLKPTDFVVGFCGRLVVDKGIIELVEAFDLLNGEPGRQYKLLLVGDFEKRDALPPHIISRIHENKDIIVTGFIFDDIPYYYALMNLYILPSYREGFGMSVLEASSMQLPVLTTGKSGCMHSIIEGHTGFYVLNTVESILTGIRSLRDDKNIELYGINGRKFVMEHFDNSILWPIIEQELYV
jgi:glycosyltransferase involved in cell wall biosynthesis